MGRQVINMHIIILQGSINKAEDMYPSVEMGRHDDVKVKWMFQRGTILFTEAVVYVINLELRLN